MVVRGSIRGDHTIGAEGIIITYPVGMTEVTSNRQPVHIFLVVVNDETLIDPVPDAASLQLLISFNHIPIVLQAAHTVSHGMAVFHHDEGATSNFFKRPINRIKSFVYITLQIIDTRIHQTNNISIPIQTRTFVCHWTGYIAHFHLNIHILKINPVTTLIAHRPHNHRRMVLVAFQHIEIT